MCVTRCLKLNRHGFQLKPPAALRVFVPPCWLVACVCLCSEFRGGPSRLAALLSAAALLWAPAQLHGAPVGGRGGHQHGPADPAQLRRESAEAMFLVGHRLLLHHLPPLRHLLEHLCLRVAGGADPAPSLMKGHTPPWPLAWPPPTLDPISSTFNMFTDSKQRLFPPNQVKTNKQTNIKNAILLWVQSKCENRSFKSKNLPETFSTDSLQIKGNMSLLLKRDYSSNKVQIAAPHIHFEEHYIFYKIYIYMYKCWSLIHIDPLWAFNHCAHLLPAFSEVVSSAVSLRFLIHYMWRPQASWVWLLELGKK